MYKALVLVATICVSLVAANRRDSEINTRLALAVARRVPLQQKYGLGPFAPKSFRLSQDENGDGVEDTTDTSEPEGLIGCARGVASGLQFS